MKALLLGDLSPTAVTNPLFEKGDVDALFGDTLSELEGNDINFVNLECTLTEYDNPIEKIGPPLKASKAVADVLKKIGVNYCGLSNNHVFDYGIKGIEDTISAIKNAGIEYTGFGSDYEDSRKNLVIEKDGERISIIAVCEHEYSYAIEDRMGSRPYDEYDTMEDIREAKKESDRVIVIYHGGKEHCGYPSPRLYKLCRAMVKNGADVVLCQHSHCIGCYEKFNDGHILYGQGNFHFVKPKGIAVTEGWNDSLAVRYDTKTNEIEFVPFTATETGIEIAKAEKKDAIFLEFEKRNVELNNGEWKKGWHDFCLSVKENYVNAVTNCTAEMMNETDNDRFGHYLDCEAHTDVWRELFPTANIRNERR